MAVRFLQNVMEKGWLSGGDLLQAAKAAAEFFQGRKSNAAPQPKAAAADHGPQAIDENKRQQGELFALHGWLSSLWIDDKTSALEYRVKPDEAHIFPKIVAALPSGAIRRLMQTIAVEVTVIKRKKTTGFTDVKDPRDPAKVKKAPILSEWEETMNLKGQQVVSALTWLVIKDASPKEDERIKAVAETLQSFRILDNLEDTAKDKADEVWSKLKTWYGDNDSRIHVFLAKVATNRETVNRILASPRAEELWRAVETAATPEEKRERHEVFQAYLLQMVREFQNPAVIRHESNDAESIKPWFTLKRVFIGLLIGCIVLAALIAVL